MSDAQKVIATVLAAHERTGPPSECRVKHDYGCCEGCDCGSVMAYGDWAAHVAAEVDAALGTLTPVVHQRAIGPGGAQTQWRDTYTEAEHRVTEAKFAIDVFPDAYNSIQTRRRWVSGWTPEVAAR